MMARRSLLLSVLLVALLGSELSSAEQSDARLRNGLIAYSRETDRCDGVYVCNSHIWTVRPGGRGKRRLACSTGKGGCRDIVPAFAPTARRLASATNAFDYEEVGRRLLPRDLLTLRDLHGRVHRTTELIDEAVDAIAWSADGEQLAFSSYGRMYMLDADLVDRRWVFRDHRIRDLAWSRGGRLAWTGPKGTRVTNKARTRVRKLRIGASKLAWAPNGRRIAYITENKLFTVSPNGRNRRKITGRCTGSGTVSDVAWSPDGRQLLCSIFQDKLIAVNVRTRRIRVVVRGVVGRAITSFDWQRAPRRRR